MDVLFHDYGHRLIMITITLLKSRSEFKFQIVHNGAV